MNPSSASIPPKVIAWFLAVLLPVAAATASAVPWRWGFVVTYLATAFALPLVVRTSRPELDRFVHVLVLAGSAPFVVRFHFGPTLPPVGVVHVAAVAAASICVGYLLADRLRSAFAGRVPAARAERPR